MKMQIALKYIGKKLARTSTSSEKDNAVIIYLNHFKTLFNQTFFYATLIRNNHL